jgi:hypothetical protein
VKPIRCSPLSFRIPPVFITLCVCFALATGARAQTLVVLLEGLGGRITSAGIVSLQKELSAIPNTIVPAPIPQSKWRSVVKLIEEQEPGTTIVVIGYSLGANNSTYVAKKVKHVDELIAIQPSLWGPSVAIGENTDKAIEIYNPRFWRTAGLGAKRLVGVHFSYITNNDTHLYAHNDPQVHKFIFNEVKVIAHPAASSKPVVGIQPEGKVGPQDIQKVKAAVALLKSKSEQSSKGYFIRQPMALPTFRSTAIAYSWRSPRRGPGFTILSTAAPRPLPTSQSEKARSSAIFGCWRRSHLFRRGSFRRLSTARHHLISP